LYEEKIMDNENTGNKEILLDIKESVRKKLPIVLAIDDTPFVLSRIDDILGEKYDVRTSKTTTQAFAILHKEDVDLLLLDVDMPGMTGPEFFEYVKEHHLNQPKVIFITAHSDSDTVKTALKLGAEGYIIKPIQPEKLLEEVRRVLGT
jgi:two-component system nitrate/nitrite response regulator NarL